MRLPSPFNLGTFNAKRLLRCHVIPGMKFIEIGCAPGKMLAWVAKVLGAEVAGLDSSECGMLYTRQLFDALGIQADLRKEDIDSHTFEPGTFDVVYSAGLIEHFSDPRPAVRVHAELARPGGKIIITIPNLSGWWAVPTKLLDPSVLDMHNLKMMNESALSALAPSDIASNVHAYRGGHFSVQHAVPVRKLPDLVSQALMHFGDLMGFLQLVEVKFLAPLFVLEFTRGGKHVV
jgi:2-polyprenyl-3-methyl-5-hydroxy-6-metoxy-1,4-benzoquinol methylase